MKEAVDEYVLVKLLRCRKNSPKTCGVMKRGTCEDCHEYAMDKAADVLEYAWDKLVVEMKNKSK